MNYRIVKDIETPFYICERYFPATIHFLRCFRFRAGVEYGRAANFRCKIYKVASHGKHPRILFYGRGEKGEDGGGETGRGRGRQASIGVRLSAQRIGLGWPAYPPLSALLIPPSFPCGRWQAYSSDLWRRSSFPLRNPSGGTASIPHYLFYLNNSSVSRSLGGRGKRRRRKHLIEFGRSGFIWNEFEYGVARVTSWLSGRIPRIYPGGSNAVA